MILCLGTTPAVQRSMSFERVEIDGVSRTSNVSQYASGKSINAARVLQTLGYMPLAIGFAGGDAGRFLVADLNQVGIGNDFVEVEPATRICITIIDRSTGTATELIEESRPVGADAFANLFGRFERHLPDAKVVLLSGSLTPGAPAGFYADCVAAANAAGKLSVLDATGGPLAAALSKRPTVVKPNRSELRQTVNLPVETDDELKAAIRALLSGGPGWAVVTGGAKETIASDCNSFWKVSTPGVEVVSPIGSGDSFAAGLAAGLAEGQDVPRACRLAAACGSANAMTALAGHLRKADIDALIDRVRVIEF